eukprot:391054_1
MSIGENSKPRKPRTIKNAYVNFNSVEVEPGPGYCNWVPITKQQLKVRDEKLLNIKIQKIESVVNKEISRLLQSDHSAYNIQKQIITDTFNQLHKHVDEWNGVKITRTKKEIKSFKQYWDVGKNWWDLTKKKLIGTIFWFRIFQDIQQFVIALTSRIYWENEKRILTNIIKSLFDGKVKYANTKQQQLINSGTVICCDHIKTFLIQLNPLLTVQRWITDASNTNNKSRSKFVIEKLQKSLTDIVHVENEIVHALNTSTNDNVTNVNTNTSSYNGFSNSQQVATDTLRNNLLNIPVLTTNNICDYSGNHSVAYSVSDMRSSPMVQIPVLYNVPASTSNIYVPIVLNYVIYQ